MSRTVREVGIGLVIAVALSVAVSPLLLIGYCERRTPVAESARRDLLMAYRDALAALNARLDDFERRVAALDERWAPIDAYLRATTGDDAPRIEHLIDWQHVDGSCYAPACSCHRCVIADGTRACDVCIYTGRAVRLAPAEGATADDVQRAVDAAGPKP